MPTVGGCLSPLCLWGRLFHEQVPEICAQDGGYDCLMHGSVWGRAETSKEIKGHLFQSFISSFTMRFVIQSLWQLPARNTHIIPGNTNTYFCASWSVIYMLPGFVCCGTYNPIFFHKVLTSCNAVHTIYRIYIKYVTLQTARVCCT